MLPASNSRKAVVTGSSSGIGRSIASKFETCGIQTAVTDVVVPENAPNLFFAADLTRSAEVKKLIDAVKKTMGNLDILVCNAGRGIHEKLTEGNPKRWENIFRLNVFATMRLIRAFVPAMVKQKKGGVVFISSVSADHAHPYGGIYTATKAAVDQLAETLRLEVQPDVRITVIHPGVVNTDFFNKMISGTHTPEDIGWGALQPDQIAETVFFAISQPPDVMLNDIVMRPVAQPM